jgi:predicted metal-dependent phosphoesterase TrpH
LRSDLHLHTTASDGRLRPAELVMLARNRGLDVIAITDHDSVGGIDEAVGEALKARRITVVAGVEINTDLPSGELHVLGYFIDHLNADLMHTLEKIRDSRIGRAKEMVRKLQELGLEVEWGRILELARGESICRPHIAQAMLEKGFVSSEREAFDRYIGRSGPAYIEREKIKPEEAVRIVKGNGGLPVLAHPADIPDLDNMLARLVEAGLVGIEAYYGQYDQETISRLVKVAAEKQLLTTGGSDYHHFLDSAETPIGSVDVPEDSIMKLFARAGQVIHLN